MREENGMVWSVEKPRHGLGVHTTKASLFLVTRVYR